MCEPVKNRTCKKCNETMPIDKFKVTYYKNKKSIRNYCVPCYNSRHTEYYNKNKEKFKKYYKDREYKTCECGRKVKDLTGHKKTLYHKKYIENKKNDIKSLNPEPIKTA